MENKMMLTGAGSWWSGHITPLPCSKLVENSVATSD